MTEEELMNHFATSLRKWRKRREMSQTDVAVIVGVDQDTISRFERGARRPSWCTVIAICRALRISPMHLLPDGWEIPPGDDEDEAEKS